MSEIKYNRSDKLRIRCERMLVICPEGSLRRVLEHAANSLRYTAPEACDGRGHVVGLALRQEHADQLYGGVSDIPPDVMKEMLTLWTEPWRDPS